jgi:hypothetical protein
MYIISLYDSLVPSFFAYFTMLYSKGNCIFLLFGCLTLQSCKKICRCIMYSYSYMIEIIHNSNSVVLISKISGIVQIFLILKKTGLQYITK